MSNTSLKPLAVNYADAAKLLGLCPRSVFSLVKSGQLPAARIGRSVRIPIAAVEAYLLRLSQQD